MLNGQSTKAGPGYCEPVYLDRIYYLQLGSDPGVVHGIILEIAISLEYLDQAFLVNYFENCLATSTGESKPFFKGADTPGSKSPTHKPTHNRLVQNFRKGIA